MTRKEEIEKYARECAANQVHCIEIDITHACEWADKTMIDKACEWIEKNFNMPNDFQKHFRKAMEK